MRNQTERVIKQFVKLTKADDSYATVKLTLNELYHDKKQNPHEIVRTIFNVTKTRIDPAMIRYFLKRYGIKRRTKANRPLIINKKVANLNFETPRAYFLERQDKTFIEMADELDVSVTTVIRAYREYLKND